MKLLILTVMLTVVTVPSTDIIRDDKPLITIITSEG